jgi:CBS domain-containing protein
MGRVSEILARKGCDVHSIQRDSPVYEALEQMVLHNVGSLIVLEGETIAGIFTERDFLRRVALEQLDPKRTTVREVMTERLVCLDPERTVQECMAIMTQERIRHLPVLDGRKLAGMVSIGDLVKHLSDEREVEVRYLTDYITGKYPG